MALIKKNISNQDYHSHPAISASGLKLIYKKSVYHYLNRQPFSSAAMTLGSAVHTGLNEPEKFYNEYYVLPKADGRTEEGKRIKAEAEEIAKTKIILNDSEMEIVKGIKANFDNHETAQYYSQGEKEASFFGEMDGVPVKVRPDNINEILKFISDIKTCQDNSPSAFRSDIYKYGYHLQAAFYCWVLGYDPRCFRFITTETKYPYSVEVYAMSDKMIEDGQKALSKAWGDWSFYFKTKMVTTYTSAEKLEDGSYLL